MHYSLFGNLFECKVVHLAGVRQVLEDSVQQGLNPLILEGGANHDRRELAGNTAAPDGVLDLLLRWYLLHYQTGRRKLLSSTFNIFYTSLLLFSRKTLLVGLTIYNLFEAR